MKKNFLKTILILIPVLLAFSLSAQEINRVAILPLTIYSQEKLDYLKEGLLDMLSSRISSEGKIITLEKSLVKGALNELVLTELNEKKARELGKKVKADFLVWGSLTKFGESVSLDLKLLPIKEDKPLTTFSLQTKGMDELIPKVSELVQGIQNKILGAPPISLPLPAPQEEKKASSRPSDLFVFPGAPEARGDFWRSHELSFSIKGMDVGDVDGDGKNELILIDQSNVYIYKVAMGEINLLEKISGKSYENYIALDVADINGNGIPEIFVTSMRDVPHAFVLEFQGNQFRKIAHDIKWFLRVLNLPSQKPMLIGQKSSGGDWPFKGEIYQFSFKDQGYLPEKKLDLPEGLALYHFTPGDLDGDGKNEFVVLDGRERLMTYSSQKNFLWSSVTTYGGSQVYFEKEKGSSGSEVEVKEYVYIPVRMVVKDLDQNGINEILTVRNIPNRLGRILEQLKTYERGEIYNLSWSGRNLIENWRTREIEGCIADFQIKDLDNDGQEELVIAVITNPGFIFTKGNSLVLAYAISQGKL